ncbi:hypothetical protein [Streptomyces sp900116325]|uniref:hypothetical protein n=1 Tax=Streptomyces sp. 900116325 TaxID=3154295 RepID=UPI0033BA9B9D
MPPRQWRGACLICPSRLHTLRIWHAMWVERIDEAIAAVKQREKERRQGEERRPATPDWIVELSIGVGARPVEVHVAGVTPRGSATAPSPASRLSPPSRRDPALHPLPA